MDKKQRLKLLRKIFLSTYNHDSLVDDGVREEFIIQHQLIIQNKTIIILILEIYSFKFICF